MKKIVSSLSAIIFCANVFAQIYIAKTCEISFFSKTAVEDIAAVNKSTKPMLNTATGDIQMKIAMTGFVFEKPLMQEHFNENYVESEKFPVATFKGKINEKVDYTKDGDYKVTVTGKLNLHGVEKDRTIDGLVSVKGAVISTSSSFKIKFADHNVVIPRLYSGIIPEDTDVKLDATLEKYLTSPKVKIGMTKDEVVKIMGQPDKINETVTKGGKTELLFYNKTTINIDVNGKVDYINNDSK